MWERVPLKEVANVASGFGFPKKYQGVTDEKYPFFKVGDMNLPGNEREMCVASNTVSDAVVKELKAKVFPAGTIIFPKIGAAIATNKKRILRAPAVVDNNVMGLIPKGNINPWYLYYWMQQFDLRSVSNIGPVPSMRKSEVEQVRIPYPPPSEQRRIVEILDQADALRKQRAEADKKAARILPALFYQMFGDPARNDKGWDIVTGKEIFSKVGYGVGSPPPFTNSGIPFLRAGNIKPRGINNRNLVFFDEKDAASISRSLVHAGDVVIVRRGAYTGDCVVIPERFDGAYVGYDLICKPSDSTNPYWFAAAWNYPTIWQRIEKLRSRAAQQGLNKQQIESFKLPRPPKYEQDKFERVVRSVNSILANSESAKDRIETLFEVLLHKAFSGGLTNKWREAHLKELLQEMELQTKAIS